MSTATAIPPIAAKSEIVMRRRSRNAPVSNSRRASSPTTRKKSVIRPSLTHSRSWSEMPSLPTRIDTSVVQNES